MTAVGDYVNAPADTNRIVCWEQKFGKLRPVLPNDHRRCNSSDGGWNPKWAQLCGVLFVLLQGHGVCCSEQFCDFGANVSIDNDSKEGSKSFGNFCILSPFLL